MQLAVYQLFSKIGTAVSYIIVNLNSKHDNIY